MKALRHREQGVALIVVILMISIIVVIALQMNRASRSEVYDAANLRDRVRLFYVAKSGFSLGQVLLRENQNSFDALNEVWATADKVVVQTDSLFGARGELRLVIEDESGKIPINKLVNGNDFNLDVRNILIRLLSQPEFGLNQNRAQEIVEAIKDWIDTDDNVTGEGAESSYYSSLAKPYTAKNGPLDCIDELLMIKGISQELYDGSAGRAGLKDLVTLYGDGRININTAPKLVLRSLSQDMTVEAVEKLDNYRKTNGEDLSIPTWYQKIVTGIAIDTRLITTRSDYFRVSSVGVSGDMRITVTGILMRDHNTKKMKLLSWKAE